MQRSDFHFDLPKELIAQHPPEQRGDSRLLYLDGASGAVEDRRFRDIGELLRPGDLLVFNDTKVIPARLHGNKASGGKVEILIERLVSETEALAHMRSSRSPKPGSTVTVDDTFEVAVTGREGSLFCLSFPSAILPLLEQHGHMPLPPYIEREDAEQDLDRYQTVYARREGAVAAPTAGLHFDQPQLNALQEQGVELAFATLHVGAGTFQPVRVDDIREHTMHSEYLEVDQALCDAVARTRERGGRVVAVGTTAVRCLESAARDGALKPMQGETDIFIYPGYRFRVVDALITNFHLPESTLLMLVSAFAGYEQTMAAYRHAVAQRYRFFSYGDAMFILPKQIED